MKRLSEIDFMRPILVVLLVFYHAFIVYDGGWRPFMGFVPIMPYKALATITYSFMLESYVMVSGYVMGFQQANNRIGGWGVCMLRKVKRLLIPSFFFSVLYLCLFHTGSFTDAVSDFVLTLGGVGHLWFLPMLFLCFAISLLLDKISWLWLRYVILLLFFLVKLLPYQPFQISSCAYYLLFFYIGKDLYKHLENKHITIWQVIASWLLFIFLFGVSKAIPFPITGQLPDSVNLLKQVFYSMAGSMAFFTTALFVTQRSLLPVNYVKIGELCFGVYIFQQFFLQIMYYKTDAPVILGPVVLPWISFVVVLITSLLCTALLRKTIIGKALVG